MGELTIVIDVYGYDLIKLVIFRNYSSSNLESDVLAASNCSKCQMKFTFFIMINYVGHNIKYSKFNFSKRFKKK